MGQVKFMFPNPFNVYLHDTSDPQFTPWVNPTAKADAFKLYFSKNVIEVGREWVLEPRPWLSRVSKSIRSFLGR